LTLLAGVIGWPVAQSRSPLIHRHWMREHGVDGDYLAMPVRPEMLGAALRGLAALGFAGCNVTVPHKEHAARAMGRLDDTARRMGAVNLVVVEADGSLSGFNTDGAGFLANLRGANAGWRPQSGPALVVGAGGAARSIVASLLDAGVPAIRLANRTAERARRLADDFGVRVEVVEWERRALAADGAALLVNTTSQGMAGQPALDLRLDALPRDAVVCDIVYNPLVPPLLAAARARGNPTVDGLGMLLHQARPAFAAWFDIEPEVTPALRRLIEATLPG
jgi:shikimate dehydrogenase